VLDGEKLPLDSTWPRLGEHQDEGIREWLE
jgi:hypothetical protein